MSTDEDAKLPAQKTATKPHCSTCKFAHTYRTILYGTSKGGSPIEVTALSCHRLLPIPPKTTEHFTELTGSWPVVAMEVDDAAMSNRAGLFCGEYQPKEPA